MDPRQTVILFFVTAMMIMKSRNIMADVDSDVPFGACQPGKESCSECYLALKQSLLKRDDNVQSLSRAFFPSNASNPVFVTVTYNFGNNTNTNNSTEVWYWSYDSSYLFFEITTFQYLSLFFSKPAAFYSQKVSLTLDKECYTDNGSNSPLLKLLTQRVSIHV